MTAKANWFLGELEMLDEEPDPFAVPIEEVGQKFDLRNPSSSLQLRLAELVSRESKLHNAGVCCSIKERPDTCCHACPVSQAHDAETALGVLCRVGREQENVATELAVLACRDER